MSASPLQIGTSEKIQDDVFRVVTLYSFMVGYQSFRGPFDPEDGGSMDLRNVGILPQHCTASQPRRPRIFVVKTSYFSITYGTRALTGVFEELRYRSTRS
jgi:hypothetical protein